MTLGARKYKDSTPHLRVGDSAFEDWFQAQSFGLPSMKWACRDSYAAGMGDPLVVAVGCFPPVATAEVMGSIHGKPMLGCLIDSDKGVRLGDKLYLALTADHEPATAAEIDKARDLYETGGVEIDDDAKVNRLYGDVWVQAWLRVEERK